MEESEKNKSTKNKKTFFIFFQKIFLLFWVSALIGHYLEVILSHLNQIIYGGDLWVPIIQTTIPLSPPYGIGMIFVVLVNIPLIKKYKLHPFGAFALNVFITGLVEYICAAIIVAVAGYNRYWGYSGQPFNINGYVCLKSAIIFGIGATIFIYLIYPLLVKTSQLLKKWQFNLLFWVLFLDYAIELILLLVKGGVFN